MSHKSCREELRKKIAQARRLEAFFKEKKVPFRRSVSICNYLIYEIPFDAIPFIPKEVGYFWQHYISVIQSKEVEV